MVNTRLSRYYGMQYLNNNTSTFNFYYGQAHICATKSSILYNEQKRNTAKSKLGLARLLCIYAKQIYHLQQGFWNSIHGQKVYILTTRISKDSLQKYKNFISYNKEHTFCRLVVCVFSSTIARSC